MGISPVDTGIHNLPGFATDTPLWFGILAESAQATDGKTLGPVGGRIVTEAFLRVLKDDPDSILDRNNFRPRPPISPRNGEFTIADLLTLAGVAERP